MAQPLLTPLPIFISADYAKTIWVSRISLSANCNSAASCNGSLHFESGKPMHMYDWMDGAISIDLRWSTCFLIYFSWLLKTNAPKRVVTIVHFTTISGHFLANPFNIFHKTEALFVILN